MPTTATRNFFPSFPSLPVADAATRKSKAMLEVRIKRKREEPSLPGFVLGGAKRPSLARLAVGAAAPAAADGAPPTPVAAASGKRFRLARTENQTGRAEPLARGVASQREARQAQQKKEQAAWRFTQVQISRAPADAGGRTVLEIERRRVAARRPQKGIVPSGQPLPPSPAAPPAAAAPPADGGIDDAMMAQIFADADELGGAPRRIGFGTADAAAEQGGAPPAPGFGGAAADDDFVYDVYEVLDDDAEGEGAEAAEASAAAGGGSPEAAGEELWWEEVGPELVSELEGGLNGGDSGHDSDSNGEHDYPEDEDDDSLDDGDDGYEGVRMRGPPGNHDWFC